MLAPGFDVKHALKQINIVKFLLGNIVDKNDITVSYKYIHVMLSMFAEVSLPTDSKNIPDDIVEELDKLRSRDKWLFYDAWRVIPLHIHYRRIFIDD